MYRNIRKSLADDAARFGSDIQKIEEEIRAQCVDIEGLQQVTATLDVWRWMFKRFKKIFTYISSHQCSSPKSTIWDIASLHPIRLTRNFSVLSGNFHTSNLQYRTLKPSIWNRVSLFFVETSLLSFYEKSSNVFMKHSDARKVFNLQLSSLQFRTLSASPLWWSYFWQLTGNLLELFRKFSRGISPYASGATFTNFTQPLPTCGR